MPEPWIDKAKSLSDSSQADAPIQELISTGANKVAEYGATQAAAGEYLKRKQEIPSGLIAAIQRLGEVPSGFTGLSVYQAYLEMLRQKRG